MDVGKLTLSVIRDGNSVRATEIRSTRPMAAQILKGKTPAQVLQIVPLLFSVCGRAQGAAADAALQAAQHGTLPAAAEAERMIGCEATQEHLWRVLLDWPKLLGLKQQEKLFAGWFALLRKISAGEAGMDEFRQSFERDGMGIPLADWRKLGSYRELQAWWSGSSFPVAQLLCKLDELNDGGSGQARRALPPWTAVEAQQACAGKWGAGFSARPDWSGEAAETGAWTYYMDDGMLHDVQQQGASPVLQRLLARVLDVAELADGRAAPRLNAMSPAPGEGLAVVRTARGLLMHHVRMADGNVAEYEIVAPTEWNFHPQGAYVQGMRGLAARDAESLEQAARIEALSLDPCVAYEVEIRNA